MGFLGQDIFFSWSSIHYAVVSLDQGHGIQPLGIPEQQRCHGSGCVVTSVCHQGSTPGLILQAQLQGPGQVQIFPYLTEVYSFQGHPNRTCCHLSWKWSKEGHDEGPVDCLEERLVSQAVKILVTPFILLLKICDTCGWTLEDRGALSQSGCTTCVENLWSKEEATCDDEPMGR